MNWLGDLNQDILEKAVEGEFDGGLFETKSEVCDVVVDKAYLTIANSGAVAYNIDFKKENGQFVFAQEWIKSGDEKGNKMTYTDKKTGKERPLPGLVNIIHFYDIVKENMKDEPEPAKLERKNGYVVDAKVFKKLRGKKLKIAVQAYEDEYNGEVNIRTRVVDFMDLNGNNYKGEEKATYWIEKFRKEPIKKLKDKKPKDTSRTEKAKEALAGW